MYLKTTEEKCTGCRLCQQVCAITHHREINPKKSAIQIKATFPSPGTYTPVVCNQCGVCAAECPVGAIEADGDVFRIDPDVCTDCGVCVESCPSGAMLTHRDNSTPMKCDLCWQCVRVCNTGALSASAVALGSVTVASERGTEVPCTGLQG